MAEGYLTSGKAGKAVMEVFESRVRCIENCVDVDSADGIRPV